jgi:RNA polymerase sigma factor (sigma-70 family)
MLDDQELLRAFVRTGSQDAFTALVRQKLPLVLSAALRRTNGDAATAEDIAQAVFSLLARKSGSLLHHPVLTGWLYTTTHHLASKAMRRQTRRRNREARVSAALLNETDAVPWENLRPVVDAAMLELSDDDRTAVLLRFFENRSFGEIGAALQLTENAARMRVNRALETLHSGLSRRGVTSTAAALGLSLSGHAVTAVSPALSAAIAQSAVSASVGTGLFFAMTSASLKTTGAVALALLAVSYGLYERGETSRALARNAALQQSVTRLQQEKQALILAASAPPPAAAIAKAPPLPTTNAKAPNSSSDAFDPAINPDARKLYLVKQAAQLTMNVKPYFQKLGLSEEQWTRYVKILLEGMEVELDARALAREKNLTSKQQEQALVGPMTQVRRDLVEAIGAEANQQLIQFNQRLAVRPRAEELAAKLAFTDQPLTSEQSTAMVTVLAGYRNRGALPPEQRGHLLPARSRFHRPQARALAAPTRNPPTAGSRPSLRSQSGRTEENRFAGDAMMQPTNHVVPEEQVRLSARRSQTCATPVSHSVN